MKASAAVVAIGLACVVAGCSDDDEETPQGREQPSLMAEIAVQGGSRRERDLLRTVARGMDRTTLQSISIGPVTGRRKADFGGTAVPVAFTATPGPSVRRVIVAGAFSRRLLAAGLSAEVDASSRAAAFTARPMLKGQPEPETSRAAVR